MTDRLTTESAYLAAKSRFEAWREKFEIEYWRPVALSMVRRALASLSDEQRAQLRAMDEKGYDEVIKMLEV